MSSADGQVFDRSTKVTLREGSQYGAALATDGAALYLAWVSSLHTHEVRVRSSLDGLTFNDVDQAFGSSSIASPALAANTSDGSLFMAWTEPTKDIQVGQLAIKEGPAAIGWLGQSSLPGQETLHGPSLVMYEFQQSGTGVPPGWHIQGQMTTTSFRSCTQILIRSPIPTEGPWRILGPRWTCYVRFEPL
jgi:hypothetical protein